MRYRVTYRKRFDLEAEETVSPAELLNVPEGVVLDAKFVEQSEPGTLHGGESLSEEEDDFLAFGSEVWEYQVTPGREGEFEYAVQNSAVAMDLVELEEELDEIDVVTGGENRATGAIN